MFPTGFQFFFCVVRVCVFFFLEREREWDAREKKKIEEREEKEKKREKREKEEEREKIIKNKNTIFFNFTKTTVFFKFFLQKSHIKNNYPAALYSRRCSSI